MHNVYTKLGQSQPPGACRKMQSHTAISLDRSLPTSRPAAPLTKVEQPMMLINTSSNHGGPQVLSHMSINCENHMSTALASSAVDAHVTDGAHETEAPASTPPPIVPDTPTTLHSQPASLKKL